MASVREQRGLVIIIVILSAVCASRPRVVSPRQSCSARDHVWDRRCLILRGGGHANAGDEDQYAAGPDEGKQGIECAGEECDPNASGNGQVFVTCHHRQNDFGPYCMECNLMSNLQPVAKKARTDDPEEDSGKKAEGTKSEADLVEGIRNVFRKSPCFSYFGSTKWNDPVDIYYQAKGDAAAGTLNLRKIRLPASVDDLGELVRACDTASGGQETGGSDIKAYVMDINKFATSFEISRTGIISTVQTILAPEPEYITAEPKMLSIYQSDGAHEQHPLPAPDGDILGQLVVTLPQSFTGGDLIVRHKEVVSRPCAAGSGSDGSKDDPKDDSIQWAAFSSDCVRGVEKVTSGARISLTYNLYKGPARLVAEDLQPPIDHDLYAAIDELLSSGNFTGTLGFPLEHTYASPSAFIEDDDEDESDEEGDQGKSDERVKTEESFKGRDLLVHNTLTCLAKKHPTIEVEKKLVVKPENCADYMYIEWAKFHHGHSAFEDLVIDKDFVLCSYDAENLQVTWVREPRKEEFVYKDEARSTDHKGRTCESKMVSCAGCLLAYI